MADLKTAVTTGCRAAPWNATPPDPATTSPAPASPSSPLDYAHLAGRRALQRRHRGPVLDREEHKPPLGCPFAWAKRAQLGLVARGPARPRGRSDSSSPRLHLAPERLALSFASPRLGLGP